MTGTIAGWAKPEQWLYPKSREEHTWQEQGILCHINLSGYPLPIYGCKATDGTLWRITPDMQFEDRRDDLLKWESESGQSMPRLTQREAVDLIGPDANFVYNPWVRSTDTVTIEEKGVWHRLFSDRPDFAQTPLLEPTLTVKPDAVSELVATPEKVTEVYGGTVASVKPEVAPYYATETFIPASRFPLEQEKPSWIQKVLEFFRRLFGR